MSDEDRQRWDARHAHAAREVEAAPELPSVFADLADRFPHSGRALELACGRGQAALWLARRGMEVLAVDVSPVAIDRARAHAAQLGLSDRCRFEVSDLDEGLPPCPPVDLVLCHLFRDARLDRTILQRLAPGGLLAIAVLSEVGVGPGSFRAKPGELRAAFGELEVLTQGESGGKAWLLGRRAMAHA